jgi:eukaryotic-like serine/threonine-protein kinase
VSRQVLVHSLTVHKGLVVDTVPGVGTQRPEGTSVKLLVSRGPQHVLVPHVQGLTQADATTALTDVGFHVTVGQRYSSSVASGIVITSHPVEGKKVVKGKTVTLVVSRGPHLYPVPSVGGESIEQAVTDIRAAGFNPDPRQTIPGGPGIVLKVSPTGSQPHGTTIELDYF